MKTRILLILISVLFLDLGNASATHYIVEDGDFFGTINLINSDTMLMTGGEVNGLHAYNTSTATILDTIPMGPGNAGIDRLDAYDSSTIHFSGGSILNFEGFDSSTINIDGGIIRYLWMKESSIAHLSGGQIQSDIGIYDDTSYVHIYGYEFDYDPSGGGYNDGLVTGYWPDGELFSITLSNREDVITYDQLIFHIIPEPASILLVGIGGIFFSRKTKR